MNTKNQNGGDAISSLSHDEAVSGMQLVEMISRLLIGAQPNLSTARDILNLSSDVLPNSTALALRHLHSFLAAEERLIALDEKRKQQAASGSVYVIEYENGAIKIGKSSIPDARVKALATVSAASQSRHWVSESSAAYGLVESLLHKKYADSRQNGEFFNTPFEVAVAEAEALIEASKDAA